MTLPTINVAADTWSAAFVKVNNAIDFLNQNVVSTDATANGKVNPGNAYMSGTIGVADLAADSLRGGNVQATAVLPITSNVSVGNSTANVRMGFGTINIGSMTVNSIAVVVGTSVVNSTAIASGANLVINTTAFLAGNSTVNAVISQTAATFSDGVNVLAANSNQINITGAASDIAVNATGVSIATGNSVLNAAGLYIGSNVAVNTSAYFVGNSTVNSVLTATSLDVDGGASFSGNVTVTGGNLNAVVGNFSGNVGGASATFSGNVTASSRLTVGNSTVNVAINSTSIDVDGNITAVDGTLTGNLVAVSANLSTILNVGANASLNTTSLFLGNTTANLVANSLGFVVGDVVANSTTLKVGNTFINSTTVSIDVGTGISVGTSVVNSTALAAGANVIVNTTAYRVGNSTVNAVLNSIALVTGGTVVNNSIVAVGANAYLNTSTLFLGNSTVNTVINSTAVAVDGPVSGTTASFANVVTTGDVWGGATVFAGQYHLTAGATAVYAANAAAAAITYIRSGWNVTGGQLGVNSTVTSITGNIVHSGTTATFTAVTMNGLSVGSNVSLSTSQLSIGNSTVNSFMNSTSLSVNGTITASGLITGQNMSTGNVTASGGHIGGASGTAVFGTTGAGTVYLRTNGVTSAVGQATLNATGFFNATGGIVSPQGEFSGNVAVGANVILDTTKLSIGNSTVNSTVNTTQITVGGNVVLTNARITVGNSTVNSFMTSTAFSVDGTIAAGGAITSGGAITGTQNFISTGVNAILASNGGAVYMRPNGAGSATAQVVAFANGLLQLTTASTLGIGTTNILNTTAMEITSGTKVLTANGSQLQLFDGTAMTSFIANSSYVGVGGGYFDGEGLQFPATQVASTNANRLDDYEEGTFTPVIEGTTTPGTGTYTTQNGQYMKVGKFVFFEATLVWTAHTGTGNMIIEGLPFTTVTQNVPVSFDVSSLTWVNTLQGITSGTSVLLRTVASGGVTASLAIDTAATIRCAGWFMTSA